MFPLADAASEDDAFHRLASVWDHSVMPQLQDRFLTRQDELLRILKADDTMPTGYAFRTTDRTRQGIDVEGRPVLQHVSLEALADSNLERVRLTFRLLASSP